MLRAKYLAQIETSFTVNPICALLGPRQIGKTTLAKLYRAKHYAEPDQAEFFDLEDPQDLARLANPMLMLQSINKPLIIIDEIQRLPELFPILRVLIDQTNRQQKFLILGSASRELIRQSSESLAGRISYIELPPFTISEIDQPAKLWLQGGFPLAYLAETTEISYLWRQSYITTFLEQDIPNLGFNIPAPQLRRYWLMLAHYHGQIFNASELARSLSLSDPTVRRYLDILAGTFMVRVLNPWAENISKRQVKSPKIYFRDSGILHTLVNIKNFDELYSYHRLGAFWEGFALEQIIQTLDMRPEECFFWATHADAELDLLIFKAGKRIGFEFKYGDRPSTTKSMHIALADLKLDHLALIYPGDKIFPLTEQITAYGLETVATGEFITKLQVALK